MVQDFVHQQYCDDVSSYLINTVMSLSSNSSKSPHPKGLRRGMRFRPIEQFHFSSNFVSFPLVKRFIVGKIHDLGPSIISRNALWLLTFGKTPVNPRGAGGFSAAGNCYRGGCVSEVLSFKVTPGRILYPLFRLLSTLVGELTCWVGIFYPSLLA